MSRPRTENYGGIALLTRVPVEVGQQVRLAARAENVTVADFLRAAIRRALEERGA
jgi:hypothetical protein